MSTQPEQEDSLITVFIFIFFELAKLLPYIEKIKINEFPFSFIFFF